MTVVNDLRGAVTRASDEELAAATAANRGAGDAFSEGLRSGGLQARGQLNKLAGVGMDVLGFDGSGRNAAAAEDAAAAAEAGKNLLGVRDIGGLRDVGHYAAGLAGQMIPTAVPAIGAGLLTGGGAIPALVAGTAATVPFELGGQLQRQDADPVAAALPAGERLRAAAPAAVGSAALQNIVPAGVAMRLAGKGGAATAKQIVGRAAADIPANAVASGGAELVRQQGDLQANPNAVADPDAALNATLEGAAGGALFGGVGAAGHALSSAGGAPGRLIGKAKEAVQGADLGSFVGSAKAKVADVAGKAQEAAQGVDLTPAKDTVASAADRAVEGLGALADKTRSGFTRVASGEEFFDPTSFAGKTEGALRAAVAEDGVLRSNAVTKWAQELPEKYLTPEVRQAATDLTDKANQAIVAKAKQAWDTAENVGARVTGLVKSFTDPATGAKKSAVVSTTDETITKTIEPFVAKNLPELGERQTIAKLAAPLRAAVQDMVAGKPLSSDRLMSLLDVAGEQTAALLDHTRRAMNITDPKELENFYAAANSYQGAQGAHAKLLATMNDSLSNGPDSVDPRTLREAASVIVRYASSEARTGTSESTRFYETRMRQEMRRYFGDKAGAVLDAAEKLIPKPDENALQKARVKTDEDGTVRTEEGDEGVLSEAIPDTKLNTLYAGKDGAGYLNADDDPGHKVYGKAVETALAKERLKAPGARFARFGDELPLDHPAAQQRMKQLIADGDKAGVDGERYANEEIGKYGAIVHETSNNPLSVTFDELAGVKLDMKLFSRSPSRVDAPGLKDGLDAVKLAELFRERGKTDGTSLVGQNGKDARAFADGIAAVQELTGKSFEVPDSTVINKAGLTWGEAKKANPDMKGANDPRAKIYEQGLPELNVNELRKTIIETETALEPQIKLVGQLKAALKRREAKGFDAAKIKEALAEARAEMAPVQEKLRRYNGELRKREVDGTQELTGARDLDPFGPTFQAGKSVDQATGYRGINSDGGEARADGAGAPSLLGAPPDPKVLAAKKAALVEKARSGDPELINHLKASDDAHGLRRAAEALQGADDLNSRQALDTANERLRELVADPDTAYGLQTTRYSQQPAQPGTGPRNVKQALDYVRQVLGNSRGSP